MSQLSVAKISPPRVRVFIDFWNYTLAMKAISPEFKTDWSKIGGVIAIEAARIVDGGDGCAYQGANV
jgi:hypothetical protein